MTTLFDTEGFLVNPAEPAAAAVVAEHPKPRAEREAKPCPHRRTYVSAGRRFCGACGRKVGEEAEGGA